MLGERAPSVELNMPVHAVAATSERNAVLDAFGAMLPSEAPDDLPMLLFGTPFEMAQQLRERQDRFGLSYVTVLEPYLDAFAPVIEQLR
ncbi:probable F420-dependent oxidoreductase, MSMEG_2516 family [Nocardia cyriacigeorgica]|uniref:Probable F420-dependent oxidoreductase, MSMEG_2516 family n=2 Tax=Nocardia cyriacigeorgica TaxID=135487 RepID=A0A4U8VSR3_9NOCA|nr:probable F420-dependent oxidoreductase, MSMEG_2516 family [Nocardia cyriacigeorgica]